MTSTIEARRTNDLTTTITHDVGDLDLTVITLLDGADEIGSVTLIDCGPAGMWIDSIYVDPDHRGGGLGYRLFDQAMEMCDGRDVGLAVGPHERRSRPATNGLNAGKLRAWYARWGFVEDNGPDNAMHRPALIAAAA